MTPLWIYAFAVLIVYGTSKLLRVGSRERYLPPGPPTVPVLGNLHQIPLTGLYRKIREWGDQYGSVFSLKMASGTAVILLDRMAIHELPEKKGSIYSDRPRDHVASIIDSGGLALWDKNIHWMSQRKVVSSALSPTQVEVKLRRIQEAEPFSDHVKRTIFSITEIVTWGFRAPIYDSWWASGACDVSDEFFSGITPGAYPPVDQFPFLKHLPDWLSPWRIHAEQLKKRVDSFWADARWRLGKRRRNGDKRDCIADNLLDAIQPIDIPFTDRQFNDFLGFLVAAGSDTTSATTLTSIRYLAAHPHVQKKAQAELDAACGADRLPLWSDHGKLPYINCIIKEGMRIRPAVPVVFPHRARQDNWYQNMLIPRDSLLLIPAWAIHHSESSGYKDPECYNPDRFIHHPNLAPSYAVNSNYMNRDHYGYGAGRHLCPGIHLAEHMQWHITATFLWAFDIVPATSAKTGEKKQLDLEAFRDSLVQYPLPYKVRFKIRSNAHMETIMRV
ncbi:cytochrome P450 [Aspergillus aurantiobrunneus]